MLSLTGIIASKTVIVRGWSVTFTGSRSKTPFSFAGIIAIEIECVHGSDFARQDFSPLSNWAHATSTISTRRAGNHRQHLLSTQLYVSAAFWDRQRLLSSGDLPGTGASPAMQFSNPGSASVDST